MRREPTIGLSRVRATNTVVSLACTFALTACSLTETIEDTSKVDYKSTAPIQRERLDVPPDLVAPQGDGRFKAAPLTPKTASGFERSRSSPPAAGVAEVLPRPEGMELRRDGRQRWLLVRGASASKIWPTVREFWQESGFVIGRESPETGILETDWAENRAKLPQDFVRRTLGRVFDSLYSTGERDKFRTRLETTPEGIEIYVTHRGMVEIYSDREQSQTVWQQRPTDPELEVEFLRRLMVRLGADKEKSAKAPIATASQAASAGSSLLTDSGDGGKVLKVPEGFERTWRRIGLALDRGGFAVEDRDRSKGIYFVRYIDPDSDARRADPGLLSRIFGARNRDTEQTEVYQVLVESTDAASVVSVRARDGKAVAANDRTTVSRMLALLQEQLKL